jgi:PKHD-type hydroxylase
MNFAYWKWDKVIPKEYCDLIINHARWEKESNGRVHDESTFTVNKKIRNNSVVWESDLSVVGCIADKYIRLANVNAGWNFNIDKTENIQISKYKVNQYYDWHEDSKFNLENPRKLSFSLQLNDEFEGGLLEFKDIADQPIMEQGSIIVFPSLIEHRVLPVTSGIRYSAVTWMGGPAFK